MPRPSVFACSHVEAVRVCSHRGRVAPEEGVAAGSLPAYGVLQKRGIWCYDIDFILVRTFIRQFEKKENR